MALGAVLLAWKVAQKYWCPDKKPIPPEIWESCGAGNELIEVGFAKKNGVGIYICGSEEHFSWWFKQVEAGRMGGLAKASNAKQTLADAKQNVPSSSSSSSNSNSKERRIRGGAVSLKRPPDSATRDVVKHYCEEYKTRYGGNPVVTGKTAGQIQCLLKTLSVGKVKNLISVYLQTDDPWFKKTKHRFSELVTNLEQLGASLEKGSPLGSSNIFEDVEREVYGK